MELKEKNFIQDQFFKNPYPFWLWIFLFAALSALLWGGRQFYLSEVQENISESPFLQVTNRDFSIFLWENPEFMRQNVRNKTGYTPAFEYGDKINMDPELADQYVIAPPEVLFRYHAWNRLLKNEFPKRPISMNELKQFLLEMPEWQPKHWKEAPENYVKLFNALSRENQEYLFETFPLDSIPLNVWRAFQGWKNYFKEGDEINTLNVSVKEMRQFLSQYPHFARNYWKNILEDKNPNYLKSLDNPNNEDYLIPKDEVSPFLRVAFFNYKKS